MRARNVERNQSLLENVQARFDHWRKTRPKREAIPEELWSAAIALTETYNIHKIARTLRLNAASLKQRVEQSTFEPHKDVVKSSSFIEIPFIQAEHTAHCQVDILRKDGSRMQIRMPHGGGTELSALVRTFMG